MVCVCVLCVCVCDVLFIDMTVLVLICWQVIFHYICLAVDCLKQPFGLTSGQLKVSIMHASDVEYTYQ